ncbi:MAG: FAD-dependent oxidoreductase [Patescibacteria group bacterium]|nr:FAD-dependent oxidoreductase [Patescibacteria group bacterium]
MAEQRYDVLIVGAGAAGLTAAIYTRRKQLTTAIISPEVGGATALSSHIENYPGVGHLAGLELMERFKETALGLGAVHISAKVTKISVDKTFTLALSTGDAVTGRALIVAGGKVPRRLKVPGEDKFFGRGVSVCATCDAPLYRGKTVAIVGGGNAAVEAALEMSHIAKATYLIHRRNDFRADEITVAKLKQSPVQLLLGSQVTAITGTQVIRSATIRDASGITRELEIDGLFLEIGADTDPAIVAPFQQNAEHEIVVDRRQRTSIPGAFAAGDVTDVAYKQTVISAGDGALAALEAHRYLTLPAYRWPTQK